MIIDSVNSAKMGNVVVTLFYKYSLDITDMPLRKSEEEAFSAFYRKDCYQTAKS
jgi:hypothetical protein